MTQTLSTSSKCSSHTWTNLPHLLEHEEDSRYVRHEHLLLKLYPLWNRNAPILFSSKIHVLKYRHLCLVFIHDYYTMYACVCMMVSV